jgi:NADH-ubiquinone oxidoreductase chain 3
MSSVTLLFVFVCVLTIVFLLLNFILAPHNPYQEKYSIFECGFHSFLGQNRTQFGVKFFIFALVYLLLDLEILVIYPFAISGYENGTYGLIVVLIFTAIITAGFVFELGKNALKIDSRQSNVYFNKSKKFINTFTTSEDENNYKE